MYYPTMNFVCVIIFVLALYCAIADARSRRSRRRIKRERREAYQRMMQDKNLANIRGNNSLNILHTEHYGHADEDTFNRDMCHYMKTHVYSNGEWYEPVSYSVRQEFIKEYFAKIYTPTNFPLTYRSQGVYIDANRRDFDMMLTQYYYNHCVKPNSDTTGVAVFIMFILFTPVILLTGCGHR